MFWKVVLFCKQTIQSICKKTNASKKKKKSFFEKNCQESSEEDDSSQKEKIVFSFSELPPFRREFVFAGIIWYTTFLL